jgi:hypothetical protein
MSPKEPTRVYQIKITLDETEPPVWRRVLVSDKSNLLDLHDVIQRVMPWEDYHLHEFNIGDVRYGDPQAEEGEDVDIQDELDYALKELKISAGDRLSYIYDFGDSWEHTLEVEKVMPLEKGIRLPACTGGARACPPEDVGGPAGFAAFLEAISNPKNEDHDELLEWAGGEYDPEEFDLEAADSSLHRGRNRDWSGKLPEVVEEETRQQVSLLDPLHWAKLRRDEWETAARDLPLRKDVVALLTYLKENKVTGTQATGNLPRKAVAAIAARFVEPPPLIENIGDMAFSFQSEDDIWPVYFSHMLAHGAALVAGGPGRIWKVTRPGEEFLILPAVAQAWDLFITWWYRINWPVALPISGFGDLPSEQLRTATTEAFKALPIDQPVEFGPFAERLAQAAGVALPGYDPEISQMIIHSAVDQIVIDPLENFGVLAVERQPESRLNVDIQRAVSFKVTEFGKVLLDAV